MSLLKQFTGENREMNTEEKNVKKTGLWITIWFSIMIILTMASLYFWHDGIKVGAKAAAENYEKAYKEEKGKTYQDMYDSAYERAEKKYHVSSRAVITIGNLEEISKLEVIKASDVEFITEDQNENSRGITAWLEVRGEGTFVVDLKAAEFIVDNEHQHILIRLPYPTLSDVCITDTRERWFKDKWGDESYREGVDLALKQRNEAIIQIQKALLANQYLYQNAQAVAESMLKNLVKQYNPEIPELIVEVEFID